MNRLFTLILLVFLTSSLSGQVVFFEDFSNGMPADFTLHDLDGNTPNANVAWVDQAWVVTPSGRAASTSWYDPFAASNDWMITSEIALPNTTGDKKLFLVWDEFTPDASYPDGYFIAINTTGSTEPNDELTPKKQKIAE